VRRDERFLSLAQINELYHELQVKYAYGACALGFLLAEIRMGCINLADVWTVDNLLVHGTCLDEYNFVSQIAYKG